MKKKISKKRSSKYKIVEGVAAVSHQLKTPLSAIKGYLEVLFSESLGRVNAKQKEYLRVALENTERTIALVKDLLDVSRIEEGKMDFKLRQSSLERIIRETIKEFFYFAKARNCTISFEVLGKTPLLKIDPLKIKQVIINIISNAVEYSKKGKGEIEISIKRKGKSVIFCCKDSGIGIPEKEKKKIFTKFYRGQKAIALVAEGSGLGLFISKAIIKRSGGKIWFRSKETKGSTFCFSLPIKK